MIKDIQQLKRFGIFRNYRKSDTKDFGKFNLFYGWNGSGKSTLSSLFRCIEIRSNSDRFPFAEFIINRKDNGPAITQNNIRETDLNIRTFNHEFIKENISWKGAIKGILLIDKAKIDEYEKLEQMREKQRSNTEKRDLEQKGIDELEKNISVFETGSARKIKIGLQSIDTTDRYYLNYNKTKFKNFISENIEKIESDESVFKDEKIIELMNAAKPDKKPSITFSQPTINDETFATAKARLDGLLKASIVSQTIQRLVDHNEIKTWVETGLDLHKQYKADQCEFCGNDVTENRIQQLEAHFNNDYKAFQDRLTRAAQWLSSQYIEKPQFPSKSEFYGEFEKIYSDARTALENAVDDLNAKITAWSDILNKKIANPLQTNLMIDSVAGLSIKAFNEAATTINDLIGRHNHKSSNFDEETKKAKERLELHYAATEVKEFCYKDKKENVVRRKIENNNLVENIRGQETKIRKIENSLSNEGLGADQFNESLHRFLGRDELTLQFSPTKKGYEIIRDNSELVEEGLSESEKTAIALVYFIIKLKEGNNRIEDTIVVIDDPISSFDSNRLYNAYAFIRVNCEKARQIFILTHNFTFFKSIRDWISRKKGENKKSPAANFYTITANNERPRSSTFMDAKETLKKYNSEYHYIFSKLYDLKYQKMLETDDHFLAANLSRKLLETFLSFKFPKSRGNFASLLQEAIESSQNLRDEGKEKILRFINRYSHHDSIETDESFVENLIGESAVVVSDIFQLIKELDGRHYQEMIEVVEKESSRNTVQERPVDSNKRYLTKYPAFEEEPPLHH